MNELERNYGRARLSVILILSPFRAISSQNKVDYHKECSKTDHGDEGKVPRGTNHRVTQGERGVPEVILDEETILVEGKFQILRFAIYKVCVLKDLAEVLDRYRGGRQIGDDAGINCGEIQGQREHKSLGLDANWDR